MKAMIFINKKSVENYPLLSPRNVKAQLLGRNLRGRKGHLAKRPPPTPPLLAQSKDTNKDKIKTEGRKKSEGAE